MDVVEQTTDLVMPLIAKREGVELYDLEHESGVLRILLDRAGGIDVDTIGELAQEISDALDEHDPLPEHKYLLEVSSPGIERKLRTPKHFQVQVGEQINLKVKSGVEGERRGNVTLLAADDQGIEVSVPGDAEARRRLAYDQVEAARTIFVWGEQTTTPGGKKGQKPSKKSSGTVTESNTADAVEEDDDEAEEAPSSTPSTSKKASAQ